MTALQVLTSATGAGTFYSSSFKLHMPNDDRSFEPMLGIYGTIDTALIVLQYKAPNGSWYAVTDVVNTFTIGLYQLPKVKDVEFRLVVTGSTSSDLKAVVYGGEAA